jgi:regulator of sigma E protease
MDILIFLLILLVLVLVHEFGHFFSAKKFGIRVDEFGFGFPPKLFGFKRGETHYSFNLLPLGGFVKIYGENPNDENTFGLDAGRSLVNKPRYKQAMVLFAGVLANFLLAWLLFSIGFMSGFPTSVGSEIKGYALSDVNLVVVSVESKSPAEMGGLKSGDKIISIKSGKDFTSYVSPDTIKSFVLNSKGKEIEIGYMRGKEEEKFIKLTPDITSGEPIIGISMDQIGVAKLPFFTALKEGMRLNLYMVKGTVLGLYTLATEGIHGKNSLTSITGPVGMVGIVGDAYELGFVYLMSFAALISVNLAVINFLPFPALDGGRLLFLLIEKIKGSRISPTVANATNMIGFGVLILLMLVVTYHDVVKLF